MHTILGILHIYCIYIGKHKVLSLNDMLILINELTKHIVTKFKLLTRIFPIFMRVFKYAETLLFRVPAISRSHCYIDNDDIYKYHMRISYVHIDAHIHDVHTTLHHISY